MKFQKRLHTLHWTLLLLECILLLLWSPSSKAEEDKVGDVVRDVCPLGSAVREENGSLVFSALPSQERDLKPEYDGGALESWWFRLARDFVNTVQKENLPYGVIEDAIKEANLPCKVGTEDKEDCDNVTVTSFNVGDTYAGFLHWWIPILLVAGVGVFVGVAFLVTGCVFWMCRCCGRCGGGYGQRRSHDCAMCSTTILLLICTLGLLGGVVLTFYTNQQSYDSFDSLRVSANTATNDAVIFTEDLLNDGIALFCHIIGVVHLSLEEIAELGAALGRVVLDIAQSVELFLTTLNSTADAIHNSGDNLVRVITISRELKHLQDKLMHALEQLAVDASSVKSECINTTSGSRLVCALIPDPSVFVLVANYSQLPNSSGINVTVDANIDFKQESRKVQQNFSVSVQEVMENITQHLNETGAAGELMRLNDTVLEQRDNVTNSTREILRTDQSIQNCSDFNSVIRGADGMVDINAGYIQQCIINQGFAKLQDIDVYRYAFGVVVSSLCLLVAVLVLVGLLLGLVGFRRRRHPSDRSCPSHSGGVFLLIAVGVSYIIGFLVLVLSAVGFFFGSNAQKVCQSVQGPDYEGFTNIVDNHELWGGSLLGDQLFKDPHKPLYLSQLLRNCEANMALYRAMNLSHLFDIHKDIVNFTEVVESVHSEIMKAVRSIQFKTDVFLSQDVLQALIRFSEAASKINLDGYQAVLDDPVLGFSVQEVVNNLTTARNNTSQPSLQQGIDRLISSTRDVENMTTNITIKLALIRSSISELQQVVIGSSKLVLQAESIIQKLTGEALDLLVNATGDMTFGRIAGFVDSFIRNLALELDTRVGRCRPLWAAYTELHITVCYDVVDGINGFWWSLGLCGVFLIPIIILAVITSTFYLKQENATTAYFVDDPYADYLMDGSSKRSSAVNMNDNYYKEVTSLEDKL